MYKVQDHFQVALKAVNCQAAEHISAACHAASEVQMGPCSAELMRYKASMHSTLELVVCDDVQAIDVQSAVHVCVLSNSPMTTLSVTVNHALPSRQLL